jgi:hypothetical protein
MIFQPPSYVSVNDVWIAGLILAAISIFEGLIIITLLSPVVANKRFNCSKNKKNKTNNLVDK